MSDIIVVPYVCIYLQQKTNKPGYVQDGTQAMGK